MIIVLDPGHGKSTSGRSDPGAVNHTLNLHEADITLAVGLKLQDLLLQCKEPEFEVVITRDKDIYVPLSQRCDVANEAGADLFVSIHCNSYYINIPSGIETWYRDEPECKLFAATVQGSLVTSFPDHADRGIKAGNFQVLRETTMTAILVEMEFISNLEQAVFLRDNTERLAQAIYDGILNYVKGSMPTAPSEVTDFNRLREQ